MLRIRLRISPVNMELVPLNISLSTSLSTMISTAPTGPKMKPPIISGRAEASNSAKGESMGTEN